jgi:hypothetical protein
MNAYGGVFLTSALVGGEWLASRPCRITPGEKAPGTHWIGGWVGPRVDLNDVKRKILTLPGLEFRPLGHPARSQSLYRLRYPDSAGNNIFELRKKRETTILKASEKFNGVKFLLYLHSQFPLSFKIFISFPHFVVETVY